MLQDMGAALGSLCSTRPAIAARVARRYNDDALPIDAAAHGCAHWAACSCDGAYLRLPT